jgi:hypothetical protein
MYKLVFTSVTTTSTTDQFTSLDSSGEENNPIPKQPPMKKVKIGRRSTKKTVAQLLDMTEVKPRAIAYSATIVCL